ncbi:MAG: ribulose-phosphate 3-epimerase [Absicoccus porci]|uniref:ribulose-phosphate 3-epimerase n=1 Tax=Absicoccus porci TaxID=2486576 RepID=UPI00240A1810|nr:ribulose-phosphate 3-epimerase [Absicoccus porci]MDD6460571.1 ribulose-phosphate 3-epimerase [Absicoccus porci]
MENSRIISPSVLSMDYSKMPEQVAQLNASPAKWLHFDVMDGHFVPNLTFGPDILKGFCKLSDLVMDVHLMVSDPAKYAPIFIDAGANMVTFHVEALDNDMEKVQSLLDEIHKLGAMAGVVVKPKTDVKIIQPVLLSCDMVLIMTVEPGFGGQSFMEDMMPKVKWLVDQREAKQLSYRIEVDGGINGTTYKTAVEAGADTLVAGSFVFKGNIIENVKALLK